MLMRLRVTTAIASLLATCHRGILPIVLLALGGAAANVLSDETARSARERMVQVIETDVRATSRYLGKESLDPRVLEALGSVARHKFVPAAERDAAYENRPLPIGYGQTISQPYIVAIMTDLLELQPDQRVLEVGTGSGYQAAILAALDTAVYTMEIIEPLGRQAARRLKSLSYDRVEVRVDDGYYGWPEHAPFDAIIVTAAASHVPPPLIKQLKPGGRMMIPVGSRFLTQQLLLITKNAEGTVTTRQILPVRFVPLTGSH